MPMTDKQLQLKIDRCRWWGLENQPFYGSLAMGLRDVLADDIPTACVDGKRVKWSRAAVEKWSMEEVRFVLLHETLHCAHGHLWRLPPDMNGNIAGDYVINRTLSMLPGMVMPKGGLVCPPEWLALAEEEIYHRLAKPKQPPGPGPSGDEGGDDEGDEQESGKGQGSADDDKDRKDDDQGDDGESESESEEGEGEAQDGSGSANDEGGESESSAVGTACGDFERPADDAATGNVSSCDEEEPIDLREEWERRVIQAQQAADAMGKGNTPADMQRVLANVLATPVSWREEMQDFVKTVVSVRNDWSRSARRHAWQRVIYPRKRADDMGLVVFCRDTSGSIGGETMSLFTAEITSAMAELHCRGLLIDCDCQILQEIWLEPGDACPLQAVGGGGTSHHPIWQRLKELTEQGEQIAGVVCLTDLYTDFPSDDQGIATLWLSVNDQKAPFGRTVKIPPVEMMV